MSLAVHGALGTLKRVLADKGKPVVLIIETNDRRVTTKTLQEYQVMQERPVRFGFEVELSAEDSQLSLDALSAEDQEEAREQIAQDGAERAEAVAAVRRLNPEQCPDGCPEGFGAVYGPAEGDHEGCWRVIEEEPTDEGPMFIPAFIEAVGGTKDIPSELSYSELPEDAQAELDYYAEASELPLLCYQELPGHYDADDKVRITEGGAAALAEDDQPEPEPERLEPAHFDEPDDTSEVVARAPDGTIVPIAAAEIDNALYDALYRLPGYDQRWRSLILQGATDQEIGILAFRALSSGDAHTDEELATVEPQFWLDGECVLAGHELVCNIRDLLGIPQPDEPCARGIIDRSDYTDAEGVIYRISQGLNSGAEDAPWFTVRVKPETDAESRVKSKNLPDRKGWQLAQHDLDIYAATHGLTKAAIGSEDDVDTPADVARQDAQAAAHRDADPVPEALRLSDTIQAGDEIIRREERRIPGIEAKPVPVVKVDRENRRITTRAGFVSFDAVDEHYRLHKIGPRPVDVQQPEQSLEPVPVSVPSTEAEFDPYAVEAVPAD